MLIGLLLLELWQAKLLKGLTSHLSFWKRQRDLALKAGSRSGEGLRAIGGAKPLTNSA
jgi:hypothetical protein